MSKKMLMIVVGVAVLVLGLMGGMFFMLWHKMSNMSAGAQGQANHAPSHKEEKKEGVGPVFPLETFIVNLADRDKDRYLRVTIQLEMDKPTLKEEMEKRLAQIRDRILMTIPAKTYAAVNTVEGKLALRDELLVRINELMQGGKISNLYFTEFVVQ